MSLILLHSAAWNKGPGNKQCRQARMPFKSTVDKSDPCWMNEDKLAQHRTNTGKQEKYFEVVLLEEEKKMFCLIIF